MIPPLLYLILWLLGLAGEHKRAARITHGAAGHQHGAERSPEKHRPQLSSGLTSWLNNVVSLAMFSSSNPPQSVENVIGWEREKGQSSRALPSPCCPWPNEILDGGFQRSRRVVQRKPGIHRDSATRRSSGR